MFENKRIPKNVDLDWDRRLHMVLLILGIKLVINQSTPIAVYLNSKISVYIMAYLFIAQIFVSSVFRFFSHDVHRFNKLTTPVIQSKKLSLKIRK